MRNLIALAFVAFTALVGFSASASASETTSAAKVACLSGTNINQLKVQWIRGGKGFCNGSVRAEDFAKVANFVAQGQTKFMIRFEVAHCPSGLAKMPAEIRGTSLVARPWDKTCLPAGQEYTTRVRN